MSVFIAKRVSAETTEDAKVVALTDDPDGRSGRCLVFQLALSFSDQDRSLGMDTYAISNEWGSTAYGCVCGFRLDWKSLELDLTAEGSEALGLPRNAIIDLDLSGSGFEVLRTGLRAVLAGVEER